MLYLATGLADQIQRHAERTFPEECCGVLAGERRGDSTLVKRVFESDNIADGNRRRRYQIDWSILFHCHRLGQLGGEKLIGYYHSHPDGSSEPSTVDMQEAELNRFYIIVPVIGRKAGQIAAWLKLPESPTFQKVAVNITD